MSDKYEISQVESINNLLNAVRNCILDTIGTEMDRDEDGPIYSTHAALVVAFAEAGGDTSDFEDHVIECYDRLKEEE